MFIMALTRPLGPNPLLRVKPSPVKVRALPQYKFLTSLLFFFFKHAKGKSVWVNQHQADNAFVLQTDHARFIKFRISWLKWVCQHPKEYSKWRNYFESEVYKAISLQLNQVNLTSILKNILFFHALDVNMSGVRHISCIEYTRKMAVAIIKCSYTLFYIHLMQ